MPGKTDSEGNKNFDLSGEGFGVLVNAPGEAFTGNVAMESSKVDTDSVQDAVDSVILNPDSEVEGAFDITFYDTDTGSELQPKDAVSVTIKTPIDVTKSYSLVHIADDGTASIVEDAEFSGDEVKYEADSFSTYAVVASSIESGGDYVIYTKSGSGTYYALAASGERQAVEISGTEVTCEDDVDITWTITSSGSGYTITNADGEYLRIKVTGKKTKKYSLDVSDENSNNVWSYSNNTFYIKIDGSDRYLSYSNSTIGVSTNCANFYIAKVSTPVAATITVHYVNEEGTQLAEPVTMPAASTTYSYTNPYDVVADIDGVTYHKTYIGWTSNADRGTQIFPELVPDGSYWTYATYGHQSTNASESEPYTKITAVTDIYVVYGDAYLSESTSSSSSSGDTSDMKPEAAKTVTDNQDGTYTLSLSITGKGATEKNVSGANVILILDTSNSMNTNLDAQLANNREVTAYKKHSDQNGGEIYETGTTTTVPRFAAAVESAEAVATQLLGLNNADYPKLVEMSLISFNYDVAQTDWYTEAGTEYKLESYTYHPSGDGASSNVDYIWSGTEDTKFNRQIRDAERGPGLAFAEQGRTGIHLSREGRPSEGGHRS